VSPRTATLMRGALAAVAFAVLIGVLAQAALIAFPRGEAIVAQPIDFLAFDCAAKVGASGADPYLAEPLRSCERDALAESGIKIVPDLVVPAPLPPYALAVFGALAHLSFREASALWFALALVAVAASIVLLRRLTDAPLVVVTIVALTAVAFASVPIGQQVPLLLCALCGAALALRLERPQLAALLTLPLMLEPHVGLPVAVALFVWQPRARRALLGGAVLLVLLSLAEGPARNLEYVRVVLPEQARGEGLEFGGQYSLSALLAAVGVAPATALALGSASYVFMAGRGAGRTRRREARRSRRRPLAAARLRRRRRDLRAHPSDGVRDSLGVAVARAPPAPARADRRGALRAGRSLGDPGRDPRHRTGPSSRASGRRRRAIASGCFRNAARRGRVGRLGPLGRTRLAHGPRAFRIQAADVVRPRTAGRGGRASRIRTRRGSR